MFKKAKITALVLKETVQLVKKGYSKEEMKVISEEIVAKLNAHGKMTMEEAMPLVKELFAQY